MLEVVCLGYTIRYMLEVVYLGYTISAKQKREAVAQISPSPRTGFAGFYNRILSIKILRQNFKIFK
jgi:hypothetical protein